MASQDTWIARQNILDTFGALKRLLGDFKIIGGRMEELKVAYIDDVAKRTELVALLGQDPSNTLQTLSDEYALLKTALDWIRTNFPAA
jgi:phage-related minor tail protein